MTTTLHSSAAANTTATLPPAAPPLSPPPPPLVLSSAWGLRESSTVREGRGGRRFPPSEEEEEEASFSLLPAAKPAKGRGGGGGGGGRGPLFLAPFSVPPPSCCWIPLLPHPPLLSPTAFSLPVAGGGGKGGGGTAPGGGGCEGILPLLLPSDDASSPFFRVEVALTPFLAAPLLSEGDPLARRTPLDFGLFAASAALRSAAAVLEGVEGADGLLPANDDAVALLSHVFFLA